MYNIKYLRLFRDQFQTELQASLYHRLTPPQPKIVRKFQRQTKS
jgi:hypothetical protein